MAALASDWLRHFRLQLWIRGTEFNETWQEARSQRPLPSLCFSGRSEKTRWPSLPLIGWDILDFSSEIAERNSTKTSQEARSQHPLPSLCNSGRSEKKDGRPGLCFTETFWTSLLKPLNGIQRNLTGSKISPLASDWLKLMGLQLWIRWTEFKETSQEARSQRPLPSLCFLGGSEKQDGRPGLWFTETFWTSLLKPLNGIQRNLTGSKISTSSTKFEFFWPIGKTRWPPWPLIGWDIFDYSSETAEQNSTKLNRKQDLNVLYQVCIFRRSVNKNDRPGRFLKNVAHCTQVHDMLPFWASCFYWFYFSNQWYM